MAERPTIAVVDDDESVRKALCRLLTALDFDANTFASGEVFLASLVERMPDCVLLDIRMPGADGFTVAERLSRESEPVPFVFVTAHGGQENRGSSPRAKCLPQAASRRKYSALSWRPWFL